MHVQDGDEVELMWQSQHPPGQHPVGRIRRHQAELVGANQGVGKIPKELVVIVQFTRGLRAHVAGVDGRPLHRLPAQHPQQLPIGLLARVPQLQLRRSAGRLVRIHIKIAHNVPSLVAKTEHQPPPQLAVELERPAQAVGSAQPAVSRGHHVRVGRRTGQDRGPVCRVTGNRLCRELPKDGHVDGNLVEEEANPAADGGAVVARRREHETRARSQVERFCRQAVMVQPQSQVHGEARMDLPVVLREKCQLIGGRGGVDPRAIVNPAAQRVVLAQHVDWQVADCALVVGVHVGIAKSQQLPPPGLERPHV